MFYFKASSLFLLSAACLCVSPVIAQTESSKDKLLNKLTADTPSHSTADLSRFYIPEFTVYNASPKSALSSFLMEYQKACFLSGEAAIRFKSNTQELPATSLNFTTSGTFTQVLDSIALRLNMNAKIEENTILFTPIEVADTENKLTTEHFNIRPDFLLRLFKEFKYASNSINESSILAHFKKDFSLHEQTTLSLNKEQSVLTVNATPSEISRVKQIVDQLYARPVFQVRTSTKIVSVPKSIQTTFNEGKQAIPTKTPLTDGEIQLIMRQLAQIKDCDIVTAPSIVSRNNEMALIEIMREHLAEKEPTPQFKWSGLKLGIRPSVCGFGLENIISYEQRAHPAGAPTHPGSNFNFKHDAKIKELALIPNGQSMFFEINRTEGMINYLVISTSVIDATGKAILLSNL